MTARSVSWTDPRKVAALLAQVAPDKPAPRAPLPARAPGGFASPKARGVAARVPGIPGPAVRVAVPQAPMAVKPAGSAGAVTRPAPPPDRKIARIPERLVHTSDTPSDRIDALVVWVQDNYPCTGAFLADDNGLTLAARGITEAHVSIVGPLLSSLVGIRSVPGIDASAGALWLGAQMMSWVEVRTDHGAFCLGAVGEEALPPPSLTQLKEALADTLRGM